LLEGEELSLLKALRDQVVLVFGGSAGT